MLDTPFCEDATLSYMKETCGHERASFPLNGNLYCAHCAPYAWQAELHRGHADEPPAVPTVPINRG